MSRLFWLISLFLGISLGMFSLLSVTNAQTSSVSANVDFGTPVQRTNMSGFLHSLDAWQGVPDSMISPLRPAWWRVSAASQDAVTRSQNLGAQTEIVLSDGYGYPLNNWKGNGAPWQNNWQNWESYVQKMAQNYQGQNVYWDIWNEPDERDWNKTTFWSGTRDQFFETYKRAYLILRQQLGPSAIIGGPSFANYEPTDLQAFIQYCNDNNLQANFLSWHELMGADNNIPSIANHIGYIRSIAYNYPNLNLQKVLINESVGPATQYNPGDILGYLYYLEKGPADGANKACWNAADGSNNCFNGSLDGLLVPKSHTPRAAWWTYKTYADMLNTPIRATSSSPNIAIFGSRSPSQVLIGYLGTPNAFASVNVAATLRNLSAVGVSGQSTTVGLSFYKIPATGEKPLSGLVPLYNTRVPVTNGTATVMFWGLKLHEAVLMKVTP